MMTNATHKRLVAKLSKEIESLKFDLSVVTHELDKFKQIKDKEGKFIGKFKILANGVYYYVRAHEQYIDHSHGTFSLFVYQGLEQRLVFYTPCLPNSVEVEWSEEEKKENKE